MASEKRATLPFYSPRVWHGMTARTWFSLLAKHKFAVSPQFIPLAGTISLFSVANSMLSGLSELLYGGRANQVEFNHPPLFVIGHWRTGTTLLHELLVTDPQFSYPNTYQCSTPTHFLLTSRLFGPFFEFLMPRSRPMDGMAVGWKRPQEDELALMNLGVGSNYLDWAFPNQAVDYDHYLTLSELPQEKIDAWKSRFVWFLKRIAIGDHRRIVLKSPTHTARLKQILEIFPEAKFLHIVRDPYRVLPSTQRTWTRITDSLSLQKRKIEYSLQSRIRVFNKMYGRFFADRNLVPDDNLHEIRFEDLVDSPEETLAETYDKLDLGDFESARAGVQKYLADTRDFQGNEFELSAGDHRLIEKGCAEYISEYGYGQDSD